MKKIGLIGVLAVVLLSLVLSGCASGEQSAAENPSYKEVMDFLNQDKTEQENYQSHVSYTYQFLNNAKAEGIQGYPVVVLIPGRVLVFAGFETADKDRVYIFPANNKEVRLEKGKSYRELNNSSPFGPGDDLIQDIMIFK